MSVQFGKCNFDGKPIYPKDLDQARAVLAPYGPDGKGYLCKDNLGILYRAFHTTKESQSEVQPHLSSSGLVITWDGRLDNREELIGQLASEIPRESSDLDIVAAAYERWDTNAFAMLLGIGPSPFGAQKTARSFWPRISSALDIFTMPSKSVR